jgi:hypothetical protein
MLTQQRGWELNKRCNACEDGASCKINTVQKLHLL